MANIALIVLSTGSIAGFAWWVAEEDETLWDAFTDNARQLGVHIGLVDPRVVVEGAIEQDGVLWVCQYFQDGSADFSHRACPSCRLELVERHATASEVDQRLVTDGGTTVDALSCPHCAFVVRGQKHDSQGADAALSKFREHMNSFDQWRRMARESLGTDPTPSDVWDEYVKITDDDSVRARTTGVRGDTKRRGIDTYPRFSELKQNRNTLERIVDHLPKPLALAAERILEFDYLEKKASVKRKRDEVRTEFVPLRDAFYDEHQPKLSSLTAARASRSWPEIDLSVDEIQKISHDLAALTEIRAKHDRYLTAPEYQTVGKFSKQFDDALAYVRTTDDLRNRLDAAQSAVDTFEDAFEPYEDHDRYLEARVERHLRDELSAARDAVEAVGEVLESASGPVPEPAHLRYLDLDSHIDDRELVLDEYESRFVDHEVETYPDVFTTEHGPLDDKQTLAVVRNEPHNLVDASAGTGKTLTLTRRIRYLYRTGTQLDDILAITFGGDAAEEMRTRVTDAIGGIDSERLNIMTIHSFARDIISRSTFDTIERGRLKDGTENFLDAVFEADAHRDTAPEWMREFDKFRSALGDSDGYIREMFKEARSFGRSPAELRERTDKADIEEHHAAHAAAALLEVYLAVGASRDHPIDHDHTIERATELVREFPGRYETRFEHVLVDEFQDVSERQLDFIQALLGPETHLFAVGDDWQSIYGFRGSKPAFFREFESRFEESSRTTLETNYRCPPSVVRASASVMLDSDEATTKQVDAHADDGDPPVLHRLSGPYDDRIGSYVADMVEDAVDDGLDYGDVMVLTRTNYGPNPTIESHFNARGIPFTGSADDGASVTFQTVHRSKGTEAPCVILAHAVDDRENGIPMEPRTNEGLRPAIDETLDHYEEERRLFYVAMTRTEETLNIVTRSDAISRYVYSFDQGVDVVDASVQSVEAVVQYVSPGHGDTPTKLGVDCGSYETTLVTWIHSLADEVERGETYRFESLQNYVSRRKGELKLTADSEIVRLD
ncbi:DEAD/DEAH box helicase [Haloferax sp. CBA1150]|uniref:DEAD/DEAH box helicase n=1 Tax=Haloferax sp. CBA1150 TaxID=2650754 RepID=UPI001CDA0C39|nr:DEAD/DEAH box helicase [Haloferax sp. CBA1150]